MGKLCATVNLRKPVWIPSPGTACSGRAHRSSQPQPPPCLEQHLGSICCSSIKCKNSLRKAPVSEGDEQKALSRWEVELPNLAVLRLKRPLWSNLHLSQVPRHTYPVQRARMVIRSFEQDCRTYKSTSSAALSFRQKENNKKNSG